MTRSRITTPSRRDMQDWPLSLQRWAEEVSATLNGGIEGDDRLGGIVRGTKPLTDLTIADVGSIKTQLAAQAANQSAATAASSAATGALSATANVSSVYGTGQAGTVITTGGVTITPTGGTAPYTYAWAKQSGDTVNVTAPTAATTTFSQTGGAGEVFNATYCCTVTDDVAATFEVCVSVYITTYSTDGRSLI
jgi:hypothetical protein